MPHSISNSSSVVPTFPSTNTPASAATNAANASGFSNVDTFDAPTAVASASTAASSSRTALQKHVDFFDRDNDGKITYGDTYDGLIALGFGSIRSSAFAFAINAGLASATGSSWWEPLTIYTDNIAAGKHPSDSDIYDEQGNFSAAKFEELFANFDLDGDNALSDAEFQNFRNRKFEDESSSFVSKLEFGLLMEIAGEESPFTGENILTRERLAEFYDGSLLYKIAGEPVPF